MTERLVTTANKRFTADQIIKSIEGETDSSFYLFIGKSSPYANGDSFIDVPVDTEAYRNSLYSEMILGKKLQGNNVMKVIRRIDWQSNTVYAQYDNTDADILMKNYYVAVNAGSYSHVYKCIYNNRDEPSMIEPDFSMVSSNDSLYETSDGYIWRYMYSVTSNQVRDFGSTTYFPVTSNTNVVNSAVPGSIENVKIEGSGSGYSNYLAGSTIFGPNDRAIGGNTLLYNISSNNQASSANNFYNGCIIYIKTGSNDEAGQFRTITDYQVNSTSKTIVLDRAFDVPIGLGATFDIYPGVIFTGNGRETSPAIGRAIINTYSNSVHRIEMLDIGSGYSRASATISVDPQITVVEANLRPIVSPWHGHGYDPASELGATGYAISASILGTEANTVPAANDFRSVGILKDPLFSNVVVVSANTLISQFIVGEPVYKIRTVRLGTTGTVSATSNVLTDPNGDFDNLFKQGDRIFLTYNPGTGVANTNMLATIDHVTNSSHLVLSTNCTFSQSGNTYYYYPHEVRVGTVISSNTSSVTMDDVTFHIETGTTIVGELSGITTKVANIKRGGIEKSFSTFVNADKYVGTLVFGSFKEDERVVQVSSNSSARFHSYDGNSSFYFTACNGKFEVGDNIVGEESGAIATINERYGSELKFRSGDFLYIENQEPISRAPSQRETFKIQFNF